MKFFRYIRFKLAWYKWFFSSPYKLGDPSLGSGEVRQQNRDLLRAKYFAKEPKLENFK